MKKFVAVGLLLLSFLSANADQKSFKSVFKSDSRLVDPTKNALENMKLIYTGCMVEFDEKKEEKITISVEETGEKILLNIKKNISEDESRRTYLCEIVNKQGPEECIVCQNEKARYVLLLFRKSRIIYLFSDRSGF